MEIKKLNKGRGAGFNAQNPFSRDQFVQEHFEGIDEDVDLDKKTQFFVEHPKKLINKVDSPDLGMVYSINAYQGCEHGCIYCYARNSHQYWGFSAGVDFEQKIIVKKNASALLRAAFDRPSWKPAPIMMSGNTDCYQPAERKYRLTRSLLEVFTTYRHPVSIITKNALILRDLDLLVPMAADGLVHVSISITTLQEDVRSKLEPRTSSAAKRIETVRRLSEAGIPVNVMVAPIIPGLNDHEVPEIIEACADAGARSAAYTMVRLNGSIGELFTEWVERSFPDRASKIIGQIKECHGGSLNDSRFGVRMKGEGKLAETINDLFKLSRNKFLGDRSMPPYQLEHFRRPGSGQLSLF